MNQDLPRWPRIAVAAAAVVGLGIGVAGTAVVVGLADGVDPVERTEPVGGPISLVAYDSCASALRELKATALSNVGPYGLDGEFAALATDGQLPIEDQRADGEARPSAPTAEAAPGVAAGADRQKASEADAAAPEHSGTNTHESDVDEPDLVKTDGRRVVTAAADGTLRVVDVATRKQTAALSIGVGLPSQLLLDGDRALVLTMGGIAHVKPVPVPPDGREPVDLGGAQLTLVDLTGSGSVLGTLEVDGAYVDARQVGSVARVVIRSTPRLPFHHPIHQNDLDGSTERNRGVIERSTIDDWLPRYSLDTAGTRSEGQLVDCAMVSHPRRYTGSAMLTVLTVDLAGQLTTGDPISIAADGNTVYGTGTSLYVADDHFAHGVVGFAPDERSLPAGSQRTEIYQFDISRPGRPVHVASGGVAGTLLNQYSLSEHEGNLRVATTIGQAPDSHSAVHVLTRQGDQLQVVGTVDGLGKGERIYSVRFLGDVGYVVTFRQTDPLYTVDLSDPARPRVTGELKITGYSAYLHPVGDGRLLGVGQEATTEGRTTGTQVSLFDTSDPAAPRRVGQFHLPGGYSEVESDPHAFLYWPDRDLVVLPVNGMMTDQSGPQAGVLVLRLSGDSLRQLGMVSHVEDQFAPYGVAPRRALVIGTELWTVSDAGLMVNDLDTLAQLAWLPFR